MTKEVRSDELPKLTQALRRAGGQLAHPCRCGKTNCTLGDHVWRSTKSMGPGPRAANLDPNARGWRWEEDDDGEVWPVPNDRTGEAAIDPEPADLHVEYMTLLNEAMRIATQLGVFIDRHRPDREIPVHDDDSAGHWCAHHLSFNMIEPRYRGDLCRTCYEIKQAEGKLPPRSILEIRRDGRKITQKDITEAMRGTKKGKKRRRSA